MYKTRHSKTLILQALQETMEETHVSRIVKKGENVSMSNEDGIPDFHQIKDNHELAELKGYEIEGISESPGRKTRA